MLISREICNQLADDEMVSRTLQDMDYFNCIVLKYGDQLARYIKRISGANDEEVEDVLQDALINVWKNLHGYRPELKLSSWLYRVVHNVTVSRWRKSNTMKNVLTEESKEIIKMNYSEEEEISDNEKVLHEEIQKMDNKYKDVIILKYFEGMNYEEISDVLKIPEGTVAARLNRGRKLLKSILNAAS